MEYLQKAGLRVMAYPEDTEGPGADLSRVEFAICWNPAPGLLKRVRTPLHHSTAAAFRVVFHDLGAEPAARLTRVPKVAV